MLERMLDENARKECPDMCCIGKKSVMPSHMSETLSGYVPDRMSQEMSERMPDRMPE